MPPVTSASIESATNAAKLHRDIEDTRERIAAYNAGALLADQIADEYGSYGWSATRVAESLRERIASSSRQLIERIHNAVNTVSARDFEKILNRATAIGPDDITANRS